MTSTIVPAPTLATPTGGPRRWGPGAQRRPPL